MILLDSHVLIWVINNSERLGPRSRQLLTTSPVLISVVSIWELGLKHKKGKLPYSVIELLDAVDIMGAKILSLEPSHLQRYESIELLHKDPFDSLLVAQSEVIGGILLTDDKQILQSGYSLQNAAL